MARGEEEKGGCKESVCFGKAASLIIRERSLQMSSRHAFSWNSSAPDPMPTSPAVREITVQEI